jgi:hypothetical protein
VLIPLAALFVGLRFERHMLAMMMIVIEIGFTLCLWIENKRLPRPNQS